MANRKLIRLARILRRTVCAHCGELYATTTLDNYPACAPCAAYDENAMFDAMATLPWLLRRHPKRGA